MQLICILIVSSLAISVGYTTNATDAQQMLLYWVPNHAGLFSQFLQTKIMFDCAKRYGRQLIAVPTKSKHYGRQMINMCQVFAFPTQIKCASVPEDVKCHSTLPDIVKSALEPEVCYSGSITFGVQAKARMYVLRAVNIDLPLRFTDMNKKLGELFRITLGIEKDGYRKDFTVVHWRRGDQLDGRCKAGLDTSVNCANATVLIEKVRSLSQDSIVYIATNEPQDSDQMQELREAGFLSFVDVAASSFFSQLDIFQILAVEVSLMLDATTFLAWGISEINDVVEHERMLAGKSFCIEQQPPAGNNQETWCSLEGFVAADSLNKTSSSYVVRSDHSDTDDG